jgi:O-antigen/teichoic acid export membrane protein
LNPLRKLASQTVLYGLSTIIGRFLNYLLVPLYTYTLPAADYGVVSEFYAYAGFFGVFLVFGLETGYFRFRAKGEGDQAASYSAALSFLILGNVFFLIVAQSYSGFLSESLRYPHHPEYVIWFSWILSMDAIAALPFARLRAEERVWRFVSIKIIEILTGIGLNLFFMLLLPKVVSVYSEYLPTKLADPNVRVGYIFLANLLASSLKLLLLLPQFRGLKLKQGITLMRPMLAYSLPMVVIGFAGMINEMLDRVVLKLLLPYDLNTNLRMLGIYGACYKLSILMSLFIQAFRYAGEPFFFSYSGRADASKVYALVMRYFVIFCVFIFLLVTLFIDVFKYFIGAEYREGLDVVPVLLLANLFLGIYVNLSVWYKLTDKTVMGAGVSIFGATLTVLLNIWLIPTMGYMGSAWATLVCYGSMVVISYGLSRRYYPIPYPLGRIFFYLLLGMELYAANRYWVRQNLGEWLGPASLLLIYMIVCSWLDLRPIMRKRFMTKGGFNPVEQGLKEVKRININRP